VPRIVTVPNALTAARLVLAPVFLWLYARGETTRAVLVFAVAAATDMLDGLAARALDQRSRLGAFLDPIADKVLALCVLFALAARGRLPMWLPVLEASRDAAQLGAALWLHGIHRPLPSGPTRVGKYATFGLAATALLALAEEFGAPRETLRPWVAAAGTVAAVCIVVSWIQYFVYFVRTARGQGGGQVSRSF
jgi:cardiolipin synthase